MTLPTSKRTMRQIRADFRVIGSHKRIETLEEIEFRAKYDRRCKRNGKTAKDHRSGAWGNRFAHKAKPIRCTSSGGLPPSALHDSIKAMGG